jgi:choline dehydrogenase-like flavoprotein
MSYDFIIIGSGPGGATVAKELSQKKKKVCILEWGDNDPLTGSFWYGARTLFVPVKVCFSPANFSEW